MNSTALSSGPSGRRIGHGALILPAVALVILAGCASPPTSPGPSGASRPPPAASPDRDGPHPSPPADLAATPDSEPRIEPIRAGGPNKPYRVLGRDYVPVAQDAPMIERGLASWYGRKFHGRRTANGEVYDMHAMTAAHPTMPLPSYARVRNPANGREVVVRVNDRGPFHPGRVIDLSYTAALKLDLLRGVGRVEVERLTFDDIRSGAWRRKGTPDPAPVVPEPVMAAQTVPSAQAVPVAQLPSPPVSTEAASGFWVQLGAFTQREGADGFHRRVAADLDWLAPLLGVFGDEGVFRLQAGPYANRDEAHAVVQRVRDALSLVPVVVQRR